MRNLKVYNFKFTEGVLIYAYFVVPGAKKSNQITNSMAISSLYFTRTVPGGGIFLDGDIFLDALSY